MAQERSSKDVWWAFRVWRTAWRSGGIVERLFIGSLVGTLVGAVLAIPIIFVISPEADVPFNLGTIAFSYLTWSLIWFSGIESASVLRAIVDQGLARTEIHAEFMRKKAAYLEEYGWRGMHRPDAFAGLIALAELILSLPLALTFPHYASVPSIPAFRVLIFGGLVIPLVVFWILASRKALQEAEARGFPVRELRRRMHDDARG